MGNWAELIKSYNKQSTPKKLIEAIVKKDEGVWWSYNYAVPYTVKRDGDLIIVHTDQHTPSANPGSGCYYINANNIHECVWD